MNLDEAPERPLALVGETKLCAVDFTDVLESGETLTGVPTVVEETTTDLTITNKQLNSAVLVINGRSVAIGKAVQFLVAGQLAAQNRYSVKITCGTTSVPAQTLVRRVLFEVKA